MTPRLCTRCGAQLPNTHGADAPCPRCLFELGFEEDVVHTRGGPAQGPLPIEAIAPHFPQLEILECIGQGGMGTVYRARQKGLGREVALKVLSADASADPAFAERFLREARALASLTHPAITSVFDFGEAGGHHYLLMEFVDGANLRQVIRAGGLSPRESLAMISQMCAALQYAHERGIVHRDIKPENVLVDKQGKLKIVDFGLAKMLGQAPVAAPHLTRSNQAMGTLHYMAPEQVERPLEVDHRADIFSLGVVFYELLTGELPLGRFSVPSKRVEVDVRFDDIVMKALAKEPDARYQTAAAVKTDVDGIASSPRRPKLVHSPSAAAAKEHDYRKREGSSGLKIFFAVVGGLLALFLVLGCLGALLLGLRPGPSVTSAPPRAPIATFTAGSTASAIPSALPDSEGSTVPSRVAGVTEFAAALETEVIEEEIAGLLAEQERVTNRDASWERLEADIQRLRSRLGSLEHDGAVIDDVSVDHERADGVSPGSGPGSLREVTRAAEGRPVPRAVLGVSGLVFVTVGGFLALLLVAFVVWRVAASSNDARSRS